MKKKLIYEEHKLFEDENILAFGIPFNLSQFMMISYMTEAMLI